tara:strand:+ start:434 stop:991 length:558 start_codon:yes stop_codon:yes gene_type:complete
MNTKKNKTKLTDKIKLKMRNEFVHGIEEEESTRFVTLDELITKHNVAQSTVYRVARNEQWKIQKDQFQQEYLKKVDKKRSADMASESIKMDNNSINLAKALYSTVGQVIQRNNQEIQKGKKGLPPTQINALANAAVVAQRLAKLALGEATHHIDAKVTENDSFRRAMELLDRVEDNRSEGDRSTH